MSANLPPLTDNDDEHRQLAQGAVREADEQLFDYADGTTDGYTVTSMLTVEAKCAWSNTGLIHESYSERDLDEICNAIIGRVATVLVMTGWQPPTRLLAAAPAVSSAADTMDGAA